MKPLGFEVMDPHGDVAVLIVEDEPLVRTMMADALKEVGFNVLEACHALDALSILKDQPNIAVVVSDVEMPPETMNGFELARVIADEYPAVRVLVSSGRMAPQAGDLPDYAEFSPKPLRPEALVRIVRSMLPKA